MSDRPDVCLNCGGLFVNSHNSQREPSPPILQESETSSQRHDFTEYFTTVEGLENQERSCFFRDSDML